MAQQEAREAANLQGTGSNPVRPSKTTMHSAIYEACAGLFLLKCIKCRDRDGDPGDKKKGTIKMSENDLRAVQDMWECEMMEKKLAQMKKDLEDATASNEGKDQTINTLTRMYWDLHNTSISALDSVKRSKKKKTMGLWIALGITLLIEVLAAVGMATQTLSASVGKPVEVVGLAVASVLCGVLMERLMQNYAISKKVRKYKQKIKKTEV